MGQNTRKVGLSEALKAVGPQADNILIGETDHDNPQLMETLYNKDALVAYAESGVTNLYLEISKKQQPAVDLLAAGKVDRAGFEKSLKDHGMSLDGGAEDNALVDQLYSTVTTATKLGMSVHLADQGNGHSEMKKLMKAQTEALFDETLESQALQAEKDFRVARTNDTKTAEFMNATSQGKALAIWGAAHGSQKDDWEEKLNGSSVKLDIYASRADYANRMAERDKDNERLGIHIGEDPPEMVYFVKEGEMDISDKAPENVKLAMQEVGTAAPTQIARAPEQDFQRSSPSMHQNQSFGL